MGCVPSQKSGAMPSLPQPQTQQRPHLSNAGQQLQHTNTQATVGSDTGQPPHTTVQSDTGQPPSNKTTSSNSGQRPPTTLQSETRKQQPQETAGSNSGVSENHGVDGGAATYHKGLTHILGEEGERVAAELTAEQVDRARAPSRHQINGENTGFHPWQSQDNDKDSYSTSSGSGNYNRVTTPKSCVNIFHGDKYVNEYGNSISPDSKCENLESLDTPDRSVFDDHGCNNNNYDDAVTHEAMAAALLEQGLARHLCAPCVVVQHQLSVNVDMAGNREVSRIIKTDNLHKGFDCTDDVACSESDDTVDDEYSPLETYQSSRDVSFDEYGRHRHGDGDDDAGIFDREECCDDVINRFTLVSHYQNESVREESTKVSVVLQTVAVNAQ